jgi:undecaprenyl diphosphate synthase
MNEDLERSELGPPPRHIGIIMDGNGRWAAQHNRTRQAGHREGVEALRRIVESAGDHTLHCLTVFGFSTENWLRPQDEVEALLELLRLYVGKDLQRLIDDGVRVRIIGERESLTPDLRVIIENAEEKTRHNKALHLTIAFNYGGRDEILRAARAFARRVAAGECAPDDLNAAVFESLLDTADLPPLDFIIRTSGENRLSNFLLWQAAYAEFIFMDVLWPDFDSGALSQAIGEFRRRERRFGARAQAAAG